jgi:AcrR family transcriptional regulator
MSIHGHGPEGALPVKQERSRQLRDKALAHTRELVDQGRFSSTSMAQIAAAVGCSVGALYFRFRDKEALIASVVEVAMAQELQAQAAQVAAGRYRGLPLRETVDRCVQDYAGFVHKNEGLIRSLYQRLQVEPRHWAIVRQTAYRMVQGWIEAVSQAAERPGDREFIGQVGIAFQFVSSTLVFQVLNDKPVRPLGKRTLTFWLAEMVMHFIGLEVPASLRRAPVARPVVPPPAESAPRRR